MLTHLFEFIHSFFHDDGFHWAHTKPKWANRLFLSKPPLHQNNKKSFGNQLKAALNAPPQCSSSSIMCMWGIVPKRGRKIRWMIEGQVLSLSRLMDHGMRGHQNQNDGNLWGERRGFSVQGHRSRWKSVHLMPRTREDWGRHSLSNNSKDEYISHMILDCVLHYPPTSALDSPPTHNHTHLHHHQHRF